MTFVTAMLMLMVVVRRSGIVDPTIIGTDAVMGRRHTGRSDCR